MKDWNISESYNWNYLYSRFGWIQDMRGVKQDSRHHAEGDVETHVELVLDEMLSIINDDSFNLAYPGLLLAAVLFHDIEKRSTTVEEPNGSITAIGHAKRGEKTVRKILYRMNLPFEEREFICKLVRWHGLPLWHGEDLEERCIKVSQEIDTRYLYYLAKADLGGRICEDSEELELNLEVFKECCELNDCWGTPYKFKNGLHRYEVINKNKPKEYVPYNDRFEVIMMSGLPGAGKNHYANKIKLPQICLDDIRTEMKVKHRDSKGNGRVVQEAKRKAKVYLAKNKSFIWNATNVTKQRRQPLIELFEEYGAKVKVVYVEVPYNTLIKQNSNRREAIPRKAIDNLIGKMEVPTINESHNLELIIS